MTANAYFFNPFLCGVMLGVIVAIVAIGCYHEWRQEQERKREQLARYEARKRHAHTLITKGRALRCM